jgi:hypothetical protein
MSVINVVSGNGYVDRNDNNKNNAYTICPSIKLVPDVKIDQVKSNNFPVHDFVYC